MIPVVPPGTQVEYVKGSIIARSSQVADQDVRKRAQELEGAGLKTIDALHVACAEKSGAEWFLTCDDQVMRRYSGSIKVINPVEFVLSMAGEPR
jgi:hypothetical protein